MNNHVTDKKTNASVSVLTTGGNNAVMVNSITSDSIHPLSPLVTFITSRYILNTIDSFSAGIEFRRQNLTSIDVRF